MNPVRARARSLSTLRSQKGLSLIFMMLLVAGVLILAVVTSGGVTTSERAAADSRDAELALQAAESALRAAEATAMTLGPSDGNSNCSGIGGTAGVCNLEANSFRLSATGYSGLTIAEAVQCPALAACSSTASILDAAPAITFNTGNAILSNQPSYLIEILPARVTGEEAQNVVYMFRITAKGWGQSPSTTKIIQSVYYPPR